MDDLEIFMLRWNKPDKERRRSYDIVYMWNLKKKKKIKINLFKKTEIDPTTQKTIIVTKGEEGRRGIN